MSRTQNAYSRIQMFRDNGERKYLNAAERKRFLASVSVLENPSDQTFVQMVYWSGCRPSEALKRMAALHIDLDEASVVIRSLKKRGAQKGRHFRVMPLPRHFVERLDEVHGVRQAQRHKDGGESAVLWPFSRTRGWQIMGAVMDAAGLTGAKACARGLRHSLGICAIATKVPETRLQSWLGHSSLESTSVYVNALGPEDRNLARSMWRD